MRVTTYTVNLVDNRGNHHGWTFEGCETQAYAIQRADEVLAEDNRGATRSRGVVFLSTADGQPISQEYKIGAKQ